MARSSERTYIIIDLKSFYASVECAERGLDSMRTKLVVADPERTDKTICLAVSPEMKRLGVKNRCRIFEIPKSIDYIVAPPRMKLYVDYSAKIYGIYLRYISKEDIHVYSIDEAFIDVTNYLSLYGCTAKELAQMIMNSVLEETMIRATCGIGTNLYLAKIALDITAKHSPDFIGYLDENIFKEQLWDHRPLTDFWRIGRGTAERLGRLGITTMRGIAEMDEDVLYSRFGIDAELLIDHAYGIEPVTIADIKAYKPKSHSVSSGQVLMRDYTREEAKVIVKEMADNLCLELVREDLVTDSISLYVGYSNALHMKPSGGTIPLNTETNASCTIIPAAEALYERISKKGIPVRRISLSFNKIKAEINKQYSIFDEQEKMQDDKSIQKTVLKIKDKYGKNAMFKGMDLQEEATTLERNMQIGGHKSGE